MNLLRRIITIESLKTVVRNLFTLLCLILLHSTAWAQTCDIYVNPSDGADSNPGSQFLPVRSAEKGFNLTPNGGKLCLASGEYFQGADADGIEFSGLNKSVTLRLQSFGGNQEILFSEKYVALDIGTGVLTFEQAGTESVAFGVGKVNTNTLAPTELNFLHSFLIRSGTIDFKSTPVVFEASVGNTLYINGDNPQKVAPESAAIQFSGILLGSNVSYATASRRWKIEPSTPSLARTINLPPLTPSSLLTINNNKPIQFAEQVFIESGAVFHVLSTSSGAITFDQGIQLNGGAQFIHSGPQSFSLAPTISGPGTANMSFSGTGMHQITGLLQQSNGALNLDIQAGTLLVVNPVTLQGTITATAKIELDADFALETVDSSIPVLTLSGSLNAKNHVFSITNTFSSPTPVEILTPATITGTPIAFSGAFSVIGGGSLPLSLSNPSSISLQNITVPNKVEVPTATALTFEAGNVVFQDSLTISGGNVSARTNANVTIASLKLTSGNLNGGPNPISIKSGVSIEGGTLTDTGFLFSNTTAEISSVLALHSITATAASLSIKNNLEIAGLCRFENGSTTIQNNVSLTCSELQTSQESSIELLPGAQLSSSGSINLEGAAVSAQNQTQIRAGSSISFGDAANQLSQTTLVWTGSSHSISTTQTVELLDFAWLNDNAQTRISGDVLLIYPQTFTTHGVTLGENATLRLMDALDVAPGAFTFDPSSELRLSGVNTIVSSSQDPISLPSTRIDGTSFSASQALQINGSLTLSNSDFQVAPNVPVLVTGSFFSGSGSINLGAGSTINVDGSISLTNDQVIMGIDAILGGANTFTLNPVSLSTSGATLLLRDSAELRSSRSLLFNKLVVNGSSTRASLQVSQPLQIQSTIDIQSDAELDFGDSELILGQAGSRSFLSNNGVTSGNALSSLTIIGQGADWVGSGKIHRLRLLFESHDLSLRTLQPDARLGDALYLESGSVEIGSSILHFEPSSSFLLSASIDDQEFSGELISPTPNRINPENVLISLSISGQVSGFPSLDDFLHIGPLFDVNISAADVLNNPPIFGLTSVLPMELQGSLTVETNTFLNVPLIVSTGQEAVHQIKGKVGAVSMKGSGTILGGKTGVVSAMSLSGGDYIIQDLQSAMTLIQETGVLLFKGTTPLTVSDEVVLGGESVELNAGLILRKNIGDSRFRIESNSVSMGAGSYIDLQGAADLYVGTNVSWDLSSAMDSDGFVTLRKAVSFSGNGGIPRLRLSGMETFLSLQSNLSVLDAFESSLGTFSLDDYVLTLESASWTHAGTRFIGSQTSESATINVMGVSSINLGGPLLLEFIHLSLNPMGQTISFSQQGLDSSYIVNIPNRSLSIRDGSVSLGHTDIVLRGSSDPLVQLDNVQVTSEVEYTVPPSGSRVKASPGSFPFMDIKVGELVIGSVGGAKLISQGETSISALRIENDVLIDPASEPIVITNRLVFGQNGSRIDLPSNDRLILNEGATIVRTGRGTLTKAVQFRGPINVGYDLDDGSVTGQNRAFQLSELVSGFEIPPESVGIKQLSILAGNTGSHLNKVRVMSNLTLLEGVTIWSGELDWSSVSVRFRGGSSVVLPEIDEYARSFITSEVGFSTSGAINIKARPLSGSLIINTAMYPDDAVVDSLILDIGDAAFTSVPSIVLNGSRSATQIDISARNGSFLNLTGSTLSAQNDLNVFSGRIFSDPSSSLETGGALFLGQQGSIAGNISVSVQGNSTLLGQMQALAFTTAGDVDLAGPWQQSTSLNLIGNDQDFIFNTAEIVIGQLIRNAPKGIAAATFTGPENSVVRVTQQLQLASGQVVLNQASMNLDAQTGVTAASNAWIAGKVFRTISSGYTGSITFPIGFPSGPRMIDLIITNPLLTTSTFGMRVTEKEPLLEIGLPLNVGVASIEDTGLYYWTLTSSVNFASSQSFSLSTSSTDPESVALLTRPVGSMNAVWKADNLSSGGFLRSAILNQGLTPSGIRITTGRSLRNGERGWIQWVDGRVPTPNSMLDIYLDDELWLSNVGNGTASPAIPISIPSETNGNVLAKGVRSGEMVVAETEVANVQLQSDLTTVLVMQDTGSALPHIMTSAPLSRLPSIVGAHAGLPETQVSVVEMYPEQHVIFESLSGGSFSTENIPSAFSSTLKITSDVGLTAFSKYSFGLSNTGPMVFVVTKALTNFVVSPTGQKIIPVNATESESETEIPSVFEVTSSYPNPASTQVAYVLNVPESGTIEVEWFNVMGQNVRSFRFEVNTPASNIHLPMDIHGMASGMYVGKITLISGSRTRTVTRPLTILK